MVPSPLTPVDCDLRDFSYMPLDVVRLRDSDIASIEAESFRAAVLSWCVSWHQSPAASLPDDDAALCRLLGYGRDLKGWLKVREGGALRGYVKCSDGRLYHPVVAEKAVEAWQKKQAQRNRTEAARTARLSHGQSQSLSQNRERSVTENVTENVTHNVTNGAAHTVTESKGEERKGRERKEEKERTLRVPKKDKSRSSIPADWVPDQAGRSFAEARGVTPAELPRFRDHHLAKGSLMADWDAAWRTWCMNAVKFGQPSLPVDQPRMTGGL